MVCYPELSCACAPGVMYNVQSSTICKSKHLETLTYPSMRAWMNTQCHIHTVEYYMQPESITCMYDNMDKPKQYKIKYKEISKNYT